jgi:hypothetical protein
MNRCSCTMAEVHRGIIYCGYYDFAVMKCVSIPDWDCPEMIEEENEEMFNPDDDVEDGDYREDAFK